ncbi:MAG: 3-oxoadipate enol-lactonase [Actinomycetota bacterium]|nr:3-oxoadipate enol-lactonase [Actinomycetota bacterium]
MSVALHHEASGREEGPVLVLGSSLGTTGAVWTPQLPAWEPRLRVVRYDHRGHGGSPAPQGPYALAELAGDVLTLLDRLGIERASLGGVSLGGMVAMWLATHAPERVERLIVCCSAAHLPPASAWHERAAAVRAAGSVGAVADAVVKRWTTPGFRSEHPQIIEGLQAMLVATAPEGYAACCEAIAGMDLRAALPGIAAPTLLIVGKQDLATPPAHGEAIASVVPGARLESLSPAAHLAGIEQPDAVADLVLEHLDPKEPR